MPINYSIDRAKQRVTAVAVGSITYSEIAAHLEKEREDNALPFRELIDATRVTSNLSPLEVRQVVEQLRALGDRYALGPTAVLVASDIDYGMMRMLEILVEDVCDIRPFRDRDQAEKWLDSTALRRPPAEEQ